MAEEYEAALTRWRKLDMLREHYKDYSTLLTDVMENFLGFKCTDIQLDIGDFISNGPLYSMVQAQRGQAKTTITAIYAVWKLIHNPSERVLILSAGGSMAKEISGWIIQIIMNMPELECMRPDASHGDRQSVEAFDVHFTLKGSDKSPSIACVGITSNLQGKRADTLIADDIESKKNSETDLQREKLRQLTKDFISICSTGKILYLGTPQSIDSIYNSLPSRGYIVRVWTGRYPTEDEEHNYGDALSPLLRQRVANTPSLRTGGGPTGDRGQPVDPVILDEDLLTKKEIDQGAAYFQLQHMLDTKLMDADRYPLKIEHLVFMNVPKKRVPMSFNWMANQDYLVHTPQDFPIDAQFYEVSGVSDDWAEFQGTHMYIDPAGGGRNGDELAWAVTKFRSGVIYLVDIGGIPGGLSDANQQVLVDKALEHQVHHLDIEDNFGAGAFRQVLTPKILEAFKGLERGCAIEGVWETGQKELRIIDTLEPLIGSQRLVVHTPLIQSDWTQCRKYGLEKRPSYSLFFQMARLTRDRGALGHDDRLDALAGSCRHWVDLLAIDKEKERAKAKNEQYSAMMRDPLGNGRNLNASLYAEAHRTLFDRYN